MWSLYVLVSPVVRQWAEAAGPRLLCAPLPLPLLLPGPFPAALPIGCCREQPQIGQWNLVQLARSLIVAGLLTEEQAAQALEAYADTLTEVGVGGWGSLVALRCQSRQVLLPRFPASG
jgi:hypothetical protein